jgi:ankyrin repeat protein
MLHDAASSGFSELVAALMSKRIDLNSKNGNGGTRLYSAVTGGLLDLAKTLIAQRANLNAKDRYGWTPLHMAARKGNTISPNCSSRTEPI